jgi:hypothetical protein
MQVSQISINGTMADQCCPDSNWIAKVFPQINGTCIRAFSLRQITDCNAGSKCQRFLLIGDLGLRECGARHGSGTKAPAQRRRPKRSSEVNRADL